MNDLGLAAAAMTLRRDGDDGRYAGWVGLSALPSAPVVEERHRRRRPWRAAVHLAGRLTARLWGATVASGRVTVVDRAA